jgi:hypothetical protein
MNTYNIFSYLLLSFFLLLITTASSDINEHVPKESTDSATLTLTGTMTNDNPDLSWNSVEDADEYLIKRLPVPATGYSDD